MERIFVLTNPDYNAYARRLLAKIKAEREEMMRNLADETQRVKHSRQISTLHRQLGEIFSASTERTVETVDGSRVVFIDGAQK